MMYRAQDLIKKKGLHYDKLLSFGEDEEIVKVLNSRSYSRLLKELLH